MPHDGESHGLDSGGMRAIAADLRNKANYKINPATEDTVEALRLLTYSDILDALVGMTREFKKMNLHLEHITNQRIQDKDVEV